MKPLQAMITGTIFLTLTACSAVPFKDQTVAQKTGTIIRTTLAIPLVILGAAAQIKYGSGYASSRNTYRDRGLKLDAYGPGVSSDVYGRPVYTDMTGAPH